MCEIDLGDPCEVWTPTTRVARKPHECHGCGGIIPPGARYHHTFMVFEGDASTAKHCAACDRDMRAFAKAHDGQTPHPSTLVDVLRECIDEGIPNEVKRWKAMLTRVRARSAPTTVGQAGSVGAERAPSRRQRSSVSALGEGTPPTPHEN